MGDYRPNRSITAQDDAVFKEAEQTIAEMQGKGFEYCAQYSAALLQAGGEGQRVSEKGATCDIGIAKLFSEHKADWNISLCGEIEESSADRLKMKFDRMFYEPELYSEAAGGGVFYRLYIRRQGYICGEEGKYICVELFAQGGDITDKLRSVRTAGDETCVSNSHIKRRVRYLPNGKTELDITPENLMPGYERVELTAAAYDDEQKRAPACLMSIDGQKDKHITGGENYTLDSSLLAKGKGWHIIIDTDKPHCTSIRLRIDYLRGLSEAQTERFSTTITVQIPTAEGG